MTQAVSVTQLRAKYGELTRRVAVGKERIVVLRRGKPLGVLIPLEDLRRLEAAAASAEPSGVSESENPATS